MNALREAVGQTDLDMLAYDIANMLDRYGYDIDAADCDIRPHLPAFLDAIQATAAARPADDNDATTWTPTEDVTEPTPQSSRRPRATYLPWARSQLVMLGATAVDEHYWQCPSAGCKVWAGPYGDPRSAKQAGFEHIYRCEKTDYFRRGQR